jgi:hypothetical protein
MAYADKTLRFVVAPTSALAGVASGMSAGTWAQMTPVPSNMNSTILVGSVTGNMIPYCNSATWNPFSKRVHILGEDHNWGTMREVVYDVASNSFSFVGDFAPGIGHGYDHYEVNPFNGDLYYKAYHYGTGGQLWRKPYGGSWNSSFQTIPAFQQVALGCCWWSGTLTGGGTQGAFLIYNQQDGNVLGYNPVGNTWFTQAAAPAGQYHGVMAYSPTKNVAVFGGGNGMERRIWKMTSTRTVTELTSTPTGCQIGIYAGGLVCDPVTGDFLVLSGGYIWLLNPDGSGTWTQQTGSRIPPAAVNDPLANENMMILPFPEHGVIGVLSANGSSSTNLYLYKHA